MNGLSNATETIQQITQHAGNPYVRFDEEEVTQTATPRCGHLLYKRLVLFITFCSAGLSFGGIVSEVSIPSESMGKDIPASIIFPDRYDADTTRRWPVVYVLHGAGGTHRRYIENAKLDMPGLADMCGAIVVCADGGKTSWWFDSPVDSSFRYETHVTKELVPWIDAHCRTFAERGKRTIMGASMGGHGACWIGFRHKNLFGAVGVVMGGVDLWGFPENWDIAKRLGPRDEFPERWREHSAVTEAAKLKNGEVEIFSIIGTSDFFLAANRKMHKILSDNKVAHTYVEIRGRDDKASGHSFSFTEVALPTVFSFFKAYFGDDRGAKVDTPQKEEPSPLVLFTAMTGKPSAKEATEYFDAAQKAGFSQLMLYPRSGLEHDYMGEEWLSFMGDCLKEAKARGMKAWLYDEFNWPSGSCKGRIPEENPKWGYSEYGVWKNADGTFRWDVGSSPTKTYPNCHDIDAVSRFMELTHRTYERRFAAYMRDGTIPGIFTDEPACGWGVWDEGPNEGKPFPLVNFRWYGKLEMQYRERTGRDFRTDVEESLLDPAKTGVWETYTELKGRQFRRAFFDQIREWADKVGIRTCGHMMDESDPQLACRCNGLPLHALCGFSLPGMDNVFFEVEGSKEWLTYSTAQYAVEHNSTQGKDVLDVHGCIELFALGPCDISMAQMVQRIWLAALYGMDTYFLAQYHTTAMGFLDKPKSRYAMFVSPTQPWFTHCGDLHAAARKAARWSRKRFVREVAVRYPQRVFGRLALGRNVPGEKTPPLKELVAEFAWNQVSFELLQDDEKSALPFVFSFRSGMIVEEKSGREFATPSDVLAWLRHERGDAWCVTDAKGATVPGVLVRRYTDGTVAVLNMTERTMPELTLERGTAGKMRFALPGCGTRLFADGERGWTPKCEIGDVAVDGWTLSRDRDTLHRIWFTSNNTARLTVEAPLKGVRWALCDYPKGSVKVTLDGRPLVADVPCRSAPYGYTSIYRETPPMDLSEGVHELALEGRADGSIFLPVLWLAGALAAAGPDAVLPAKVGIAKLAPLADLGFQDFAGVATYRTTVKVPKDAGVVLALDAGGLPARVRLGGRDLGEKALPPLEWDVPSDMAGKGILLEVEVATSVRPVFGRDDAPGSKLYRPLFGQTQVNAARSGLVAAKWLHD